MKVANFLDETLEDKLPETFRIITEGNLCISTDIQSVYVSGSRGPVGSFHSNSDLDISMILDRRMFTFPLDSGSKLKEIIEYTLNEWRSDIDLDIALLFETQQDCDFRCFHNNKTNICSMYALDCFGIYKIQKGFNGFVPKMGVDVNKVLPVKAIWNKL